MTHSGYLREESGTCGFVFEDKNKEKKSENGKKRIYLNDRNGNTKHDRARFKGTPEEHQLPA